MRPIAWKLAQGALAALLAGLMVACETAGPVQQARELPESHPPAPRSGVSASSPPAAGTLDIAMRAPGEHARARSPELIAFSSADDEIWIIAKVSAPAAAASADDAPGSGAMLARRDVRDRQEPETVPLPLAHTRVRASVTGYISTVDVAQQFENPYNEKIEAVYVFPLPEKAAVSEFVMTIGERRIRGIVREREQAEALYADARAQGHNASLLVQHRPNVFEQKVANIEPGRRIDVDIRYFHTLAYVDGWYSFVFPTVVGPRYNPPGSRDPLHALPAGSRAPGTGVRYLAPDQRSGHDLDIAVTLDAGVPVDLVRSSTHEIAVERLGAEGHRVRLAGRDRIPNRDFVLSFRVAGDQVRSALMTERGANAGHGYFSLMLYPPATLDRIERRPMEMIFVIDASGSMSGRPLIQAKNAVDAALDRLEPSDTFQVIRFSDQASTFGPRPVPATRENVSAARRYVRDLRDGGGTRMIEGVRAALDFPQDRGRLRTVAFLTDGFIGNETEILGAVHRHVGDARVFSFGVGSSVNRYLLERMAVEGRGTVAFLGLQDRADEVMDLYFERVSRAAITDLAIDWGSLDAFDVYPSRLPDLFVGRPVIVTGRYRGKAGAIRITGLAGTREVSMLVGAQPVAHASLPAVWARRRIADLSDRQHRAGDRGQALASEIRRTALAYNLISPYTAFLAVDASRRTAGSHGTTVHQPVPVPDGVRYRTAVE